MIKAGKKLEDTEKKSPLSAFLPSETFKFYELAPVPMRLILITHSNTCLIIWLTLKLKLTLGK